MSFVPGFSLKTCLFSDMISCHKNRPIFICSTFVWSHLHWSRRCSRAAPCVVELLPREQERPPPRDGASWKGNAGIYCRECPCSLSILWKVSCSGSPLHQKLQFLKIISYFRLLRNYNHLRWYLTPSPLTSWAGCLSTHPAFLDKGAMWWCQYNWEVVSSMKTSHEIIRNAKKKSSRIFG